MNKKLLAAAIAGAFVAPAVMADTSNVTIFGMIGLEAASVNTGTGDAPSGVTAMSGKRTARVNNSPNTELGFKGTEDLGNGMSAVWQIAVDVFMDGQTALPIGTPTTTSFAATRNTYVGVESKQWGRVIAGKHDTPFKLATGPMDVFIGTLGDYNALMGSKAWQGTASSASAGITISNTGAVTNNASFETRFQNMVMYTTPTINGFTANAMWAAANEAYNQTQGGQTTTKGNQYSLSAIYSNGPIYATIAHEVQRNLAVDAASATPTDKALKLGFGYNFGATKVNVIWEKMSDDRTQASVASTFGGTANQMTATVNSRSIAHKAWYIGASHTIGKAALKVAYTHMGDLDGTSDSGAKQWTVGADYNLSKRTKVYALYTKLSNERLAAYGLGQGGQFIGTNVGGSSVVGGADPSGFALGMHHSF